MGDPAGAASALGATSPGRWRRPAAMTPSESSRRARLLTRSNPPSASLLTFPGRTRRTLTAWPGTRRSRACWPPAVMTARSPSGSTSALKFAEMFNSLACCPPYAAAGPFSAATSIRPHASVESRAGKRVTQLFCLMGWTSAYPGPWGSHRPPQGCKRERGAFAGIRLAFGDRAGRAAPLLLPPC